jgi:Family of unknown function (DUF5317)
MTLVLIVIGLATGVGFLLGGRLSGLGRVLLLRRRLLVTAAGAALAGYVVSLVWPRALMVGFVAAFVLVAYFGWLNRSVPGLFLVAAGCGSNALVMAVNAGLPVSLHAAQLAGARLSEPLLAASAWREVADSSTVLPFLGQVVPLAWPVSPQVVSVGDVLIAAGCGLCVAAAMAGRDARAASAHGTMDVAAAPTVAPATGEMPAKEQFRV